MNCVGCNKEVDKFDNFNGRCRHCHAVFLEAGALGKTVPELREQREAERQKNERKHQEWATKTIAPHEVEKRIRDMLLTTEVAHNLPIAKRLEIVTAEVVVGMNIFKDMLAGVRNIVGGRSGSLQKSLRDIRVTVLNELKREAAQIGADAVVGVDLDYQEIGATGSTMLFVIASGTAVVLDDSSAQNDR